MKFFDAFAEHPFGGWIIQGISVVAFIVALKILTSKLSDSGPMGAVKAGVNIV